MTTTTPKQRASELLENYLLALAGVDRCPANARKTVKFALADNADQADLLLNEAIADGLETNSPAVEDALKALSEANQVARDMVRGSRDITRILGCLEQATKLGAGLLGAASSIPYARHEEFGQADSRPA